MKVEKTLFWSPQMVGKTIFINDKVKIFVQDLGEQQNSDLFAEGLNLITTKVSEQRREYIEKMLMLVLPEKDAGIEDTLRKSCQIGHLIAFVCDIALHNNKRLAHPDAYHKNFNIYVANLFTEYYLADCFNKYKKINDRGCVPVPEFLVKPDFYTFIQKSLAC